MIRGTVALTTIAVLGVAGRTNAMPPPPPITVPGQQLGETRSEWIVPYVRYQHEGVVHPEDEDEDCGCCGVGRGSARWYSEDGDVLFELEGVSRSAGFLQIFEPQSKIIGLLPFWELSLPKKGVETGYIRATPTGRVLLHQHHPSKTEVAVDIYHEGRFVRTIGPFPGHGLGNLLHLDNSGAFTLLAGSHRTPDSNLVVKLFRTAPMMRNMGPAGTRSLY
jgi:hypothetical protein